MEQATLTPPPDGDVIYSNRYIAGIVAMTIVAVLIAWLRMYTRIFVSRNPGWDDWTMFAASVRQIILTLQFGLSRVAERPADRYSRHQCCPYECLSLWNRKAYLLSESGPSQENLHVALGGRADQPLRSFPRPTFHLPVLSTSRTSKEGLPLDHLEHNCRVGSIRCLCLHQLFLPVQTHSESLGARDSGDVLRPRGHLHRNLALPR